ncbi:hypothetical protein PINS_up011952 [Pythium insidiosum]|nr:hypothetical protein PINS_up011952 [Pythium insidiosum]
MRDGGERSMFVVARALAVVLWRCAQRSASTSARTIRLLKSEESDGDALTITVASSGSDELLTALMAQMPKFQSQRGVVHFMLSVLLTKGVTTIRDEMDDRDGALTGQFGHCSQELLNLLLTGIASSNVFDGTVPMGDTGLVLRGVMERPSVGYLTQLEALRYCQVGHYYKSPSFPIWVIGSASHFSVCFGLDIDRLCGESVSQLLLQRVQHVFKEFDPMEAGFIELSSLRDSLNRLGVPQDIISNEYNLTQLASRLEVGGAGIILWDEYWKVISVLLHTKDLELALRGNYEASRSSGSQTQHVKSDEELARELQAQFDAEENGSRDTSSSTQHTTLASATTQERDGDPPSHHMDLFLLQRHHEKQCVVTSVG